MVSICATITHGWRSETILELKDSHFDRQNTTLWRSPSNVYKHMNSVPCDNDAQIDKITPQEAKNRNRKVDFLTYKVRNECI